MKSDPVDPDFRPSNEAEMLEAMKAEIGENGFQRRLDDVHCATFVDRSRQLLVSFEEVDRSLSAGDEGLPVGMDFVEGKNWSLLHVSANKPTWFRRKPVYALFDELVDVAFFEEFDRILFYGSGMGGYAAAAFSVAAPGSTVLAISPQATLDRERTLWEQRFPMARTLNFCDRYAYAPRMVEAASCAYVLFDPHEVSDCMHATLFFSDNVRWLKCRHFKDHIEHSFRAMDLLHQVVELAAEGELSGDRFYQLLRKRRDHNAYLRNFMLHIDDHYDPLRMAILCRHVLSMRNAPAFRRRLKAARVALKEAGDLPDWLAEE